MQKQIKTQYGEKTVMLTGAGGFLGRNLLKELLESGYRVIAVSSRDSARIFEELIESDHIYDCICINIKNKIRIKKAMNHVDILVNCGFPRIANGFELSKGLEFIKWILLTAAENNVAVINISSQSVYDSQRKKPAKESDTPCPRGDYAVAKYATELILDATHYAIPHTSIRLASLIGPSFDQRFVNKFVKSVLAGDDLIIQESGNRYGFMDVDDAVNGIIKLLKHDISIWTSIYNLGICETYTVSNIANAVISVVRESNILNRIPSIKKKKVDVVEGINSALDASLFSKEFNWSPKIELRDSIIKVLEYETEKNKLV